MQQKPKILRLMLVVITLLVIVGIFLLSNQPASKSGELSMTVATYSFPYVEKWTSQDISLAQWNHSLRKFAHFSLYFFLASIIMVLSRVHGWSWRRSLFVSLFISMSYAIIDETHQWFIDGRGASVRDVAIDSAGAMLGIVAVYLVGRRWLK
ncbi:VanZ family protein [Paenibacillus sp. FSL W7-1287]|uniref:VanZ family protein n=1 Tax=Paenibacillus sp. FSL W7-1287 TaxID=2954538 RepID=UPI0030F792BC